nr:MULTISPECIES: hypothetical protein [unclassified Salinibacterium]
MGRLHVLATDIVTFYNHTPIAMKGTLICSSSPDTSFSPPLNATDLSLNTSTSWLGHA